MIYGILISGKLDFLERKGTINPFVILFISLLALSIVCCRADKEKEPKERAPVAPAA
jgi:hypothetical protein